MIEVAGGPPATTSARRSHAGMALTLADLLPELHKLSRADKLRAMSFLVNELTIEEESLLTPGALYEVWSPYDAPEAAEKLLTMLAADDRSGDG
jgi:hypothetical protein